MKLFKNKDRGPKVKSTDVHIPEDYLEYEREAEYKKNRERALRERYNEEVKKNSTDVEDESLTSGFEKRIEEISKGAPLRTIKKSNDSVSEQTEEAKPAQAKERSLKRETSRNVNASAKQAARQAEAAKAEVNRKKRAAKKEKRKEAESFSPAFVVLLVFVVFLVAGLVTLLGPVMNIDKVEVSSVKNVEETQIEEMMGNPVGQNLFLFRTSKAEEALRQHPYVKNATITRHYPHYLEVTIEEREPAGVILNDGKYLQFSKDGVLLNSESSLGNQSLPIITGFTPDEVPSPGETFKNNERFTMILDIVNACSDDLLTMIQEINVKDKNNILAYTSQGLEIRIGNTENIEKRMQILDDIMNQVILSNVIDEELGAIDVRSEKAPVVVLKGYENLSEEELKAYIEEHTTTEDSTSSSNTKTSSHSQNTTQTTSSASQRSSTTTEEQQNTTEDATTTQTDTTQQTTEQQTTTTQ